MCALAMRGPAAHHTTREAEYAFRSPRHSGWWFRTSTRGFGLLYACRDHHYDFAAGCRGFLSRAYHPFAQLWFFTAHTARWRRSLTCSTRSRTAPPRQEGRREPIGAGTETGVTLWQPSPGRAPILNLWHGTQDWDEMGAHSCGRMRAPFSLRRSHRAGRARAALHTPLPRWLHPHHLPYEALPTPPQQPPATPPFPTMGRLLASPTSPCRARCTQLLRERRATRAYPLRV